MTVVTTRDKDIISKSFRMLTRGAPPSTLLQQIDWQNYFNVFSSATGDNRYVNPITQCSPATDPRYGRMMQTREGGMGSIYKEVYENNVTLLTITPGTAQFAGLLTFITNMFSPTAAIIANKGRAPGLAFYIGQAAGSIAFWPMQLVSISVQFLDYLFETPRNSFYTVKPAMGAYVGAATGVLNDLLVKLGYINPILPKRNQESTDPLYGLKPNHDNSNAVAQLSMLMPDVINKDGTIDLMRMVMKGTRKHRVMVSKLAELDNESITTPSQKLVRAQQLIEEVQFSNQTISGFPTQDFVAKEMGTVGKYRGDSEGNYTEQDSAYYSKTAYVNINNAQQGVTSLGSAADASGTSLDSITSSAMQSMGVAGSFGTTSPGNPNQSSGRPSPATPGANPSVAGGQQIQYDDDPNDRSWMGDIKDLLHTAIKGGLEAITWRVDGSTGPTTDSFSNSHSPSPMAEKFNSVVKAANDFKFDIAGGNTGIDIIDGLIGTFKEAGLGALSGSVIGNIPLALANNSFVKIPDHWDGSTTNLHKESYSMYFDCTYAHPYEQIMKIWVPFSLFLPLVAPFTSGGGAYTTPFLCKAFCQGRSVIRTGLITQATFTFGQGDAGWTADRKPLNLKIDFEVTDLEPLVSVPIDRSLSILDLTNPAAVVQRMLSDDSAFNNYLSRITGISYLDTVLKYSKINRNLTTIAMDMKQSISAENMAAKVSDSVVADLLRITTKPIQR